MVKKLTTLIIACLLVIGILAVGFAFGRAVDSVTGENRGGVTGISGMAIGSDGLTVTGATTLSGGITLSGAATLDGGLVKSNTNSTSTTATSYTMVLADIQGYDTMIMTPNTGALTMTTFASSTASTWLPSAGDRAELCIYNATTTSAATITIAAGTGFDLERTATSTTSGADTTFLAIPAGGHGCFDFMRQPATASAFDISALYTPFINND